MNSGHPSSTYIDLDEYQLDRLPPSKPWRLLRRSGGLPSSPEVFDPEFSRTRDLANSIPCLSQELSRPVGRSRREVVQAGRRTGWRAGRTEKSRQDHVESRPSEAPNAEFSVNWSTARITLAAAAEAAAAVQRRRRLLLPGGTIDGVS